MPLPLCWYPLPSALALSAALPRRQPIGDADSRGTWTHDCQVPWCPELISTRRKRCGLLAIETDIGLNSGVVRSPVQALDWFVQGLVGPESGMGAVFVGIANID